MTRREFFQTAPAAGLAHSAASRPTPEDLYNQALKNPQLHKHGYGEQFCWNAAYYLPFFLRAFLAWKDAAWLDWGLRYYEFLVSKMQTGPDGYKGWIGPYIYDDTVWCDVHVGDAILCGGLLDFAELVLNHGAWKPQYREAAERYVELARTHLIEKWDQRGSFETSGPYGGYRAWDRYGAPGELKKWTQQPHIKNSRLSLPFNKQNDMALAALKLYRITGDEKFRRRAAQIFAFHKSRFQLVDDCLLWNYWEPFGQEDIDFANRKTRHWVGVHPYRNYQAREVEQIAEAYHTGVVFDERDIRRITNTNLRVMWNGDENEPRFRNSNARLPGNHGEQTAGTLWTALADFDETVRRLMSRRTPGVSGAIATISRAYFDNVTLRRPASYERLRLRGKPERFEFPFHPCAELNMAAALPAAVRIGETCLLAANILVRGYVETAVFSADGAKKLEALEGAERFGQSFVIWKPTRPGAYRVRWALRSGAYREVPVTVTG